MFKLRLKCRSNDIIASKGEVVMGKFIKLNTNDLKELRKVDPRLVSWRFVLTNFHFQNRLSC